MMRWIATSIVLMMIELCAAGCAQEQRVSADPLGGAPTDFSLEMTILTGEQSTPSSEAHLRQSRYVLFADGSLHHGEDADRAKGGDWLPPLTRVLTRRQVAEVWSLAQHLGFTDPENAGSAAINFKLVRAPVDGVTHIAGFRAWGKRWSFTRDATIDQPDLAMTQLVRPLARLSWASDRPRQEVKVMPKRYDFGPDPYQRYRQPGGAGSDDADRRFTMKHFAAIVALACALGGCLAHERPPEASRLGEVISDVSLTLDVRDATAAEEYYQVKRDGAFGFGGGMDARFERITWTTQLTADEMRSLRDLMLENGWFKGELRSTNQPKDARYTIEASCDAGSLHKRIDGENDRVEPVRHALREIANRRLQNDLERQPKPGMQQPAATQP